MKIYQTITELVLDAYNSEGQMPSYEKITPLVREHFPNSQWLKTGKTHYAWYKSAIKRGDYTERISPNNGQTLDDDDENQIDREVEDSIVTQVSMERDLRNYLSSHLTQLESNLTLHDNGVEYRTDVGNIDILAIDEQKNLVVVEVKAGMAMDKALGQILGYMGCLSDNNKGVRGIIVALDFDNKVVCASRHIPNIRLAKYTMSFGFADVQGK